MPTSTRSKDAHRSRGPLAVIGLATVISPGNLARADVVCAHNGQSEPAFKCWQLMGAGVGVTVGPVVDDGGIDAWFVDDDSTAAGSLRYYQHAVSAEQVQAAASLGWKLSVRLRIVDLPDPVAGPASGSPAISYRTGEMRWDMHFGSDDAGNPAVELVTGGGNGITFPLDDAGYHFVELAYEPTTQTASLFIDGRLRATGYEGVLQSTPAGVLWGAFTQNDTGHANYAFVQFAIGDDEASDCNSNGILDACDIQTGSVDTNGDGIPDECQACLAADLDGDHTVGVADLLLVLSQWGPCPPLCVADVDGDGTVNVVDLLAVLASWGQCP